MNFETHLLQTMVGGVSALDAPHLYIKSLEDAYAFVKSYGFDLHDPTDVKKAWYYHRRALVLIQEKLLDPGEVIPEVLVDPKKLQDIRYLLLLASRVEIDAFAQEDQKALQKWACALLRVIHVFVHSENDLFSFFAAEIQKQILLPFQECVVHEGGKILFKHPFSSKEIHLKSFETKPFKNTTSSVIKMLAKSDIVALKVLDKLGMRFVTESVADSFRLMLYMAEKNLLSFAHVMPDQSSNNLYPLNLFLECLKVLEDKTISFSIIQSSELSALMTEKLGKTEGAGNAINYLRKENAFSDQSYRFIKFICRKLIHVDSKQGGGRFSFFYPFEVQIVDEQSHLKNIGGPSSHLVYKTKQRQAARARVLPNG